MNDGIQVTEEERDKILKVLKDHLRIDVNLDHNNRNGLIVRVDLDISIDEEIIPLHSVTDSINILDSNVYY